MGNCIERSKKIPEKEDCNKAQEDQGKSENENGSMRIKIVLTKDELDLLLLELNNRDGKRQLEDVLVEIQRSREKAAVWKPCLDSIVETPEAPEITER